MAVTGCLFWSLNTVVAIVVGPIVDRIKINSPHVAFIGFTHVFLGVSIISLAGNIFFLVLDRGQVSKVLFMICAVVAGNMLSFVQPLANDGCLAILQGRPRPKVPVDDENLVLTMLQLLGNIMSSIFVELIAFEENILQPAYLFVYMATAAGCVLFYLIFRTFDGHFPGMHNPSLSHTKAQDAQPEGALLLGS